ncbi:hypothetical protein Tco_0830124 [Tanacetum coccineum]
MIEPEKPLKKKDQIKFDEEEALRLQAKFDEEDRLAKEKAQQVEEANIAWDDIKNDRWKPKDLKNKFLPISRMIYEAMKRVNTFVDMDTELVKEKAKKQKVDDDQEAAKMKELMKIVPDEEEVSVDVIPLMLRCFDRENLETLWKLVKAKHGYTRLEGGYERVLWGDLKTMFEHHVEDLVWRNLQGNKVLV